MDSALGVGQTVIASPMRFGLGDREIVAAGMDADRIRSLVKQKAMPATVLAAIYYADRPVQVRPVQVRPVQVRPV